MSRPRRLTVRCGSDERVVNVGPNRAISIDGDDVPFEVIPLGGSDFRVTRSDTSYRVTVVRDGSERWVFVNGQTYRVDVVSGTRAGGRRRRLHESLTAPMPATVKQVPVTPGTVVARGDVLVVLEAMKMELPLRSPDDGTVTAIHCAEGDLVQPGVPLVELE